MAKNKKTREELEALSYYSIYEAAELLGVSHMTIRRRIEDGSLKAGKVGQQWRIRREDLQAFVSPQN